jgi:hypothetical protein
MQSAICPPPLTLQQGQQAALHHCTQFVFIGEMQKWVKKSFNGTKTKLQEDQYLIFPGNRNKFTNTGKETQQ